MERSGCLGHFGKHHGVFLFGEEQVGFGSETGELVRKAFSTNMFFFFFFSGSGVCGAFLKDRSTGPSHLQDRSSTSRIHDPKRSCAVDFLGNPKQSIRFSDILAGPPKPTVLWFCTIRKGAMT